MNSSVLLLLDLDDFLIIQKDKKIYQRQGLYEFLDFCLNNYHVGIFTSKIRKNTDLVLNEILSYKKRCRLQYILSREYTLPDPEPVNSWDTIKHIDTLDRYLGIRKIYKRILLLDNDARKLRSNHESEILVCSKFVIDEQAGVLKNLQQIIKDKLDHGY